jgi:acyl-CoA synthetase (NDP forming)
LVAIEPLIEPSSVAIVGASSKPGRLGNTTLNNVIDSKIEKIYPINPKENEISGLKCYTKVSEVPGDIDLALLCVPAPIVPQVISECINKKVKAIIIFSGGFRETGEEGAKLQSRVEEIVAGKEIGVLGPNCVGVYNLTKEYNLTLSPTLRLLRDRVKPGNIGFLTQSGVFGVALFTAAMKRGIYLSKMFHLGNKMGIKDADILEYLEKDSATKVIVQYMEDVKEGPRFLAALKKVTKVKPVVAIRVGRTEAGARASASHVGALKGPDEIYSALFKQGGAIRAKSSFEALDMAWTLSLQPPLKGNKIGIVTNSGGQGVEITDLLTEHGLEVPKLSPDIQERLLKEDAAPRWGSTTNPIDLTAPMPQTPDWYFKSAKMLLESGEIDGLILVVLGTPLKGLSPKLVGEAKEILKLGKPLLISTISALENDELLRKQLEKVGFPVYTDPYVTARCMIALHEYGKYLRR